MAGRFYHERRRGFAVQVCSLCYEGNRHDEELMRAYCRDPGRHHGSTAVLVTWSPEKYLLVRIRPFPANSPHGNFIKCVGGKLCRGEQCTYAHSDEEVLVWNTLLDEKRLHVDSRYKPPPARPAWQAFSTRQNAGALKYGVRPALQLQSRAAPAVNRSPVQVSDKDCTNSTWFTHRFTLAFLC